MENNTNNTARKVSARALVNNSGCDIRDFDRYFLAVVNEGAELPEELADLFVVEVIEVADGFRGIINAA